jgi:hypothetical protein
MNNLSVYGLARDGVSGKTCRAENITLVALVAFNLCSFVFVN